MKKGWRIFWIIIALIAGLGIVLSGVSLVMGVTFAQICEIYPDGIGIFQDMDDEVEDNLSDIPVQGEVYVFQDITSLEMNVGLCDVKIMSSTDDKVRVDTTDCRFGAKAGVVVQEKEGKLLIKTVKKGKILNVLSFSNGDIAEGELKVYLPENLKLDTAELSFGASDVECGLLKAEEVILKVGAADFSVTSMDVGTMRADIGAGDAELKGKLQGDMTVKSGAGDLEIELQGRETDYNYSVKSGVGGITIGNWEYGGFAGTKEIDNGSDRKIDIACGAGDVEIEFTQ